MTTGGMFTQLTMNALNMLQMPNIQMQIVYCGNWQIKPTPLYKDVKPTQTVGTQKVTVVVFCV